MNHEKYEKEIAEIRKEYPIHDHYYVENPLDSAFIIEVDMDGNETPLSIYKNNDLVRQYRVKRSRQHYKSIIDNT